jgi:transcriptional regulator with XRE-family HTH domain
MIIGDRLRAVREEKKLSQGDIEKRTGLLRCYISRVENGHTVPAVETLEKLARAFEMPLWQVFAEPGTKTPKAIVGSVSARPKDDKINRALVALLPRIKERDRGTLLKFASTMAGRRSVAKRHRKAV